MPSRTVLTLAIVSGWLMCLVMLFVGRDRIPIPQTTLQGISERQLQTNQRQYQPPNQPPNQTPYRPHTQTLQVDPTLTQIPDQATLEKMTELQLELLLHRYISSPQTTCTSVERMGKLSDGGWDMCLDPRYTPDPKGCLVYSFGIAKDFSFDDDMEAFGCEVHSFDPSLKDTKDHLRGQRIHFHLEGIGAKDIPNPTEGHKWKLFTLRTFRQRLGHDIGQRRVDVLKMDVEGTERTVVPQIIADGSAADIPQICFELHHHTHRKLYLKNLDLLRECYNHGLRIFHTNRNIHCPFKSKHTHKTRTQCHEVYMVNVTLAR